LSAEDLTLLDRYLSRLVTGLTSSELTEEDVRADLKRTFIELASENLAYFRAYLVASISDASTRK
jgi:hypothetical protein